MKFFPRESGVLLHITSLPGPYGIGEIGQEAFKFIDILSEMGQSLWQILPIADTGSCNSPYTTVSAFANNPLLISFDGLIKEGYLKQSDLNGYKKYSAQKVDYNNIISDRIKVLDTACERFLNNDAGIIKQQFESFCSENDYWLHNYTLFLTLKQIHHNKNWTEWEMKYSSDNDKAFEEVKKQYKSFIQKLKIQQYLFYIQWLRLKKYANKNGIRIVGDIPIYISHDSADVWANSDLFKLDKYGHMKFQSGCPPDYFLEDGQVWGHPIYNWAAHEKSNYQWWIDRLRYLFTLVDIVRIDHFNGFAKYWEIPIEQNNDSTGKWVKGPGEKLLLTVKKNIGSKPIIADDLGEATKYAKIIRDKFDIPGMKILQMSFGKEEQSNGSIPELNYKNIVIYTGTHDNDTSFGWLHTKPGKDNIQTAAEITLERKRALKFLGTDGSEFNWDFISLAMNSKANTVIIPLQDILGLGSNARMNTPGTIKGNWEWRFKKDKLTSDIIERMRTLTEESKRMKN